MVTDDKLAVRRISLMCETVDKLQVMLPAPIVGFGPHALSRKTTGRLIVEGAIAIKHDSRVHRQNVAEELEKRQLPQAATLVRQQPSNEYSGSKKKESWTWGDLILLAETLNRDMDSPGPREQGAYAPYETVEDLRVTKAPAAVMQAYTRLVAGRQRSMENVSARKREESRKAEMRRRQTHARKRTLRL